MTVAGRGINDEASPTPDTLPARLRLVSAAGVVVPFLGLIVAITTLWGRGVTGVDLALLVGMYVATGLGS